MSATINFLGTHKVSDKSHHGRKSTFNHTNGYSIPKAQTAAEPLADGEMDGLSAATLRMTYGDRVGSRKAMAATLPNFVVLDKKVLYFKGYMKSTVHESALENYRVRYFKIYYYLEDDTISIGEPEVENSGLPQGPFLSRCALPNASGKQYHWSDLNIGKNLEVFGKVLRLYECNNATKTFLSSEGIIVPAEETPPSDPYSFSRKAVDHPNYVHATPNDFDKQKQFLVLDRKVLRFFCQWEDPSSSGAKLNAVLFYFLMDDTIEVRELHDANDGRDPFPVFLRRMRVPRDHRNLPTEFPSSTLEVSEVEVKDYLNPADLCTGNDVTVFGRTFYLHDCDEFTREFYRRNFQANMQAVDVAAPAPEAMAPAIPPYNGIGSPEDSYLSCVTIDPKAPLGQKSLLQLLQYDNQLLRYEAEMQDATEQAVGRKFIISYRLSDDMVSIYEPFGAAADGGYGGIYLGWQLLQRKGTDPDRPEYVKPGDFHVGATLEVFGVNFVITDADAAVMAFMEANPDQFTNEGMNATRSHFGK